MPFCIVPFDRQKHTCREFDCGEPRLNRYLREQAGQDIRRYYATLFVAADTIKDTTKEEPFKVMGFYTLSSVSIALDTVPVDLRKKLPRYPDVPAIRIGRLAVDISAQGQGLGVSLIADAAIRGVSNVSAWAVMVVDAKDEKAVAFYEKIGFIGLNDDKRHLFIARSRLQGT